MTDATATLYDVTSFDGRVFPLGDYRRVIRGVVIGVGAAAAACALVTSVTVTASGSFPPRSPASLPMGWRRLGRGRLPAPNTT